MQNWPQRRCQLPIMTGAPFFKPADDPRTSSQFAKDNFSFCMDKLVKDITSDILTPFLDVFGKHGYIAKILTDVLNDIRTIIKIIYDQFLSFMDGFLRKYQNIATQVRDITLRLKATFERANTILLGVVFMGLSLVKGLMNSVDFVIKVVLIIMGIMIAIIIILFFILFPLIPLILSVVVAIVAVAIGSVAGQASSYGSGFCFVPETLILLHDGRAVKIKDIIIGDILRDGAIVESIIKMSGKNVPLWVIDDIYVSATHLVESHLEPDTWHPVAYDKRATKTQYMDGYLYCLNTSTHIIPVQGVLHKMIRFRDWEELRDEDIMGHSQWNYKVLEEINSGIDSSEWMDQVYSDIKYSAVSPSTRIVTPTGSKAICTLTIGDIVLDENSAPTEVLGIIQTTTQVPIDTPAYWMSSMLYKESNGKLWKRSQEYGNIIKNAIGCNIITNQGTFKIIDPVKSNTITAYRDFTEVGHTVIEHVNMCVELRLRTHDTS